MTGTNSVRAFKVSGMADSVAAQCVSPVAAGRIELRTQGLGNVHDVEENDEPPHDESTQRGK